jgi:hypothetical protein
MSIEFTIPTDNDSLHLANAIVRDGNKVSTAAIWNHGGILVLDGPSERLDPNIEAAILESFDVTERYAF